MPELPLPMYIGYDPFDGTSYRARQRLSAGGVGHVWLVEERTTGRLLAAKLLHSKLNWEPALVEWLRREAQGTAQINHPNVVKVFGTDTTKQGFLFIIMEYLEGRTLEDEIAAEGRRHVFEALAFGCQLLSALNAAHALGLVHRDVKPGNIFVCSPPNGPRYIKLFDFGMARVMPGSPLAIERPPDALDAGFGKVIGTKRFMSPEGAMGQAVDERADLYSAGLVLYTMLVGRDPFAHLEEHEVLAAHESQHPDPPSCFTTAPLPPELDQAVLTALAKDPSQRFQTATEFRAELEAIAEQLRQSTELLGFASAAQSGDRELALASESEPEPKRFEADAPERARRRITARAVIWFGIGLAIGGLIAVGLVTVVRGWLS